MKNLCHIIIIIVLTFSGNSLQQSAKPKPFSFPPQLYNSQIIMWERELDCITDAQIIPSPLPTSARWLSLLSRACRLSLFRRVIKLLRLLNMYRRFNTPRTTCKSQLDNKVTKCSMLLYKCRENECSINNVVKWRTQRSSSFACIKLIATWITLLAIG